VALIAHLPVETALSELVAAVGTVAPRELVVLLQGQLEQIGSGHSGSLVTLGIAGAIWSSSAAMVAIIDALNHAYDITEWRPWWKRRLVAIALTIALAAFTLIALSMVLTGPEMALLLPRTGAVAPAVALAWSALRWPVMIKLVGKSAGLSVHLIIDARTWPSIQPRGQAPSGIRRRAARTPPGRCPP
jgi:membrane protein